MKERIQERLEHTRARVEGVPLPLRGAIVIGVIIVIVLLWNFISSLSFVRALSLSGEYRATGTLEADSSSVTVDIGGRVVKLLAQEGDIVEAGAILIQLDSDSAQADLARAQGVRAEAQAKRDLAKNGARAEDKTQADAGLAQAIATRDGAKKAWDDALAILRTPQDLDVKLINARAQVTIAEQQIESAKAQQTVAESAQSRYRGRGSDLEKTMYASLDLQIRGAQENVAAAMAQRDGALTALNELLAVHDNPIDLQAQVHQAEARYHDAEAAAQIAQATRDLVYNGASKQDLAMAEAGLAQAFAAEKAAQARVDKLSLRAPSAGRISKRSAQIGEVLAPGTTAMTMVNTEKITLTVYVPQDRIGKIRLGQTARVSVDSFPGRAFDGRVTFISPQAEFTPKNVQTVEGRASQVFAVKIRLDNAENLLRPGMSADAVIAP